MGFFKSIGKKLKRVISLKNLTRVATGQFGEVGKSVLRVMSTDNLGKDANGRSIIVPTGTKLEMPKAIETVLNSEGDKFKKIVEDKVASSPAAQDAASFLTNVGFKALWFKYKNWIIGLLCAIALIVVTKLLFFRKSKSSGKR